ncbi:MAG: hypothetical protein ACXV7J_16505 [Methylomonas sp.]
MPTLYHQVRFPENQALITDGYYFVQQDMPDCLLFQRRAIFIGCQTALKRSRAGPIKAFVMQRTQARECACEIRNPSGQCCLVNFKRLENELNTDV